MCKQAWFHAPAVLFLYKNAVFTGVRNSLYLLFRSQEVLTFSWASAKPFKGKEKENGSAQVQLDGWIIRSDISQKAANSKTFFYKIDLPIGYFS